MMELELLEKTEIWIRPLHLQEVNLTTVAERVARVLSLEKNEVIVIDVREDVIALDILKKTVDAKQILGKREALLRSLAEIPGITLTPETSVHSEGILGLIDIEDKKVAKNILKKNGEDGTADFGADTKKSDCLSLRIRTPKAPNRRHK